MSEQGSATDKWIVRRLFLRTADMGGIGAAMDPRQFLQAGDVVRCEIEELGHIEATMEAEV